MAQGERPGTKPASPQNSVEAAEKAALEVLAERGFDALTAEEIAEAVGISRRTFFRYFGSKNNIPFGNFDRFLGDFEAWLQAQPDDKPMFDMLTDAVLQFNRLRSDGPALHRVRMNLIRHTPALRANAALRYGEWHQVVARDAARRMDEPDDALGPQLVAHVTIGAANAAYDRWLRDEESDLEDLVREAFRQVRNLPA